MTAAIPSGSPAAVIAAGTAATTVTAAATAVTATTIIPAQAETHAGQIWAWLAEVPDPEIPAISIVDLGIVRDVRARADGGWTVTITPTYSGCPAMQVIADAISAALLAHGVRQVRLENQLSPAWTTDWMSAEGKAKLRACGIAPPAGQVIDLNALRGALPGAAGAGATHGARAAVSRRAGTVPAIACPLCGSVHTELTSQFGSTPCKALYRCLACREPFDYFKCH